MKMEEASLPYAVGSEMEQSLYIDRTKILLKRTRLYGNQKLKKRGKNMRKSTEWIGMQ